MGYSAIPTRVDGVDSNAAADINQAQDNIAFLYAAVLALQAGNASVNSVATAYTILDDDGYSHIHVTNGAGNDTITLPTAADNENRIITIRKVDSGAGATIVDGEGAETINGMATIYLPKQYDYVTLICDGFNWIIQQEAISCQLSLDTYAGYGSADTVIMQFTNVVDNYGNMFSENHVSGYNAGAEGLEITINKPGKYSFSFSAISSVAASNLGISLNSSQLTTNINNITVTDRKAISGQVASSIGEVSVSLNLTSGDIIRPHCQGAIPTTAAICHFTATYLGS